MKQLLVCLIGTIVVLPALLIGHTIYGFIYGFRVWNYNMNNKEAGEWEVVLPK